MKRFGNIFFTCIFFLILIITNLNAIKRIPQMDMFDIVFAAVVAVIVLSFVIFCIKKGNEEGKRFYHSLDNIDNISKRLDRIEKKLNKS